MSNRLREPLAAAFDRVAPEWKGVTDAFFASATGQNLVRFVFCKKMETLHEAADRLRRFAGRGA